jgi:hypothetical protein
MTRAQLPNRRQNETVTADHAGHRFTVTVGYDAAGCPAEVFADGAKIGTDMAHSIADACVVISLALQHGCEPATLVKSLGKVPTWDDHLAPASVVGVIAGIVAEAQAPWVGKAEGVA